MLDRSIVDLTVHLVKLAGHGVGSAEQRPIKLSLDSSARHGRRSGYVP